MPQKAKNRPIGSAGQVGLQLRYAKASKGHIFLIAAERVYVLFFFLASAEPSWQKWLTSPSLQPWGKGALTLGKGVPTLGEGGANPWGTGLQPW